MTTEKDLVESIRSAQKGISLAQLLEKHPKFTRRTVQRRIKQLIDDGKITSIGNSRSRRYVASHAQSPVTSTINTIDNFPDYISISSDSRDILAYIEQPVNARTPVGYQPEFLTEYIPNQTFYLSETLRRQLYKMGDTRQTELPAGTHGRAILDRLLIDLSWASSHLEGNTYSRLDTRELIHNGHAAEGKAAIETQMILNHKSAIELLVENADKAGFNRFTILNLHSSLAENLLPNPADEGRVREHLVEIGKSVFRPLSIPSQINEMLDLILAKAEEIQDPFEQSFFVMVHLPYLQPFADINKRTSRLAANLPLIRNNLCPLTFLDVPEKAYSRAILGIYEMTRVELLRDLYVWAYERSTQEYLSIKKGLVEPDPLRLKYRNNIKHIVHLVVVNTEHTDIDIIEDEVSKLTLSNNESEKLKALLIDEVRRLHEGVLARYELKPSEFTAWKLHPN